MTLPQPGAFAIAIVDDHEAVRNATAGFLRSLGYTVVDFASGEEFLAAEFPASIGCVLLDMRMPGHMHGLSVMRTLRKRGSTIGVVIFTGRVDPRLTNVAARLDVVEIIEKPCGPLKLVDSISRAFWRVGEPVYARLDNPAS